MIEKIVFSLNLLWQNFFTAFRLYAILIFNFNHFYQKSKDKNNWWRSNK